MIGFFIKWIADGYLDHLAVFEQINGAHFDCPIFLVLHHCSLLFRIRILDVIFRIFFIIGSHVSHHAFRESLISWAILISFIAKEPVKLLHLLEVFLADVLLQSFNVLRLPLLILLLLLLFSLLKQQRYLHCVCQLLPEQNLGVISLWLLFLFRCLLPL